MSVFVNLNYSPCTVYLRNFPSYMTVPPKAVKSLPYEETPYEQLLRKLARIVAEKDWRTTTKALYLTHLLSTEISDASWAYLRKTYLSLKSASCLGMSRKGNSHHSASDKTLFSRQVLDLSVCCVQGTIGVIPVF